MIDVEARLDSMPFRVLIDEAMKLTRRHFREMYLPAVIPLAIVQVLGGIANVSWMGSMFDFTRLTDPDSLPTNFWGFGCIMAVVYLVMGAFQIGTYNVILASTTDAVGGRPLSIRDSWRWLLQGRVVMTLVVMTLGYMVGWICCCVPGVALLVVWAFVTPVMLEQKVHMTEAMGRSYDLASYRPDDKFYTYGWFKILILFVIGYVVTVMVGLVIQLPLMAVQQGLMIRSALEASEPGSFSGIPMGPLWIQVPMQLFNTLISVAVQIYVAFGVSLLFADLRGRRDGGDLEEALDALADPALPAGGVE